jgi:2-desacetyl-2-hydroxyethyl bacteriochlorophyllide A dehydrogenase
MVVAMSRGVWFVAPHQVEVRDVPVTDPAPGEVLVETAYSGVSAGTELLAYRGHLDPAMAVDETIGTLGGTFRYPFQYGYSCVGRVAESRSDLAVDELVFAFHPHQGRFVVPAADAVRLPPVDARVATLLPFVETALQLTLDAGPVLEETVVVSGLGVVGLLTATLLQRAGAQVIAVEPRPWRRQLAADLGAIAVHPDAVDQAVVEAGRADGVALVVEVSGNPQALADALRLLAFEGTALVGSWYGRRDVVLPLGDRFHRRRLTIRSSQVSTIPARLSSRWDRTRRLATATSLLAALPLDLLATHTVSVEDAADGFAALDRGEEGLVHLALGYHDPHVPGRHRHPVPREAHHARHGGSGG